MTTLHFKVQGTGSAWHSNESANFGLNNIKISGDVYVSDKNINNTPYNSSGNNSYKYEITKWNITWSFVVDSSHPLDSTHPRAVLYQGDKGSIYLSSADDLYVYFQPNNSQHPFYLYLQGANGKWLKQPSYSLADENVHGDFYNKDGTNILYVLPGYNNSGSATFTLQLPSVTETMDPVSSLIIELERV
jgi:hypothetical protein